jgi:serine/threonine protein kinase
MQTQVAETESREQSQSVGIGHVAAIAGVIVFITVLAAVVIVWRAKTTAHATAATPVERVHELHRFHLPPDGPAGDGVSWLVYRRPDQLTHQILAVKELRWNINEHAFIDEVTYMSSLLHPALVRIIGFARPDNELHGQIVTEWFPNGSLADLMQDQPRYQALDSTRKVRIVVGIWVAMRYIHDAGSIHRNLKPSNVLLDLDYKPCVSDFGSAQFHRLRSSQTEGTQMYKAPEAGEAFGSNSEVDVFSFGMMLWEILTGKSLCKAFEGDGGPGVPFDWAAHVADGHRPRLEGLNRTATDLLEKCWAIPLSPRCRFRQILKDLRSADYQLLPDVRTDDIKRYVRDVKAFERQNPARNLASTGDSNDGTAAVDFGAVDFDFGAVDGDRGAVEDEFSSVDYD